MDEEKDFIFFLNSQISYHETQIGWTLSDPQKKNRHLEILKNLQQIKDYLVLMLKTKSNSLSNEKPQNNQPVIAKKMVFPQNDSSINPPKPNSEVQEEKQERLLKNTKATTHPVQKNNFQYSGEFLLAQPKTKQLDYKLLNIISSADDSLTYDEIAIGLYKHYELSIQRNVMSRSLNRLVNENKIERITKGRYRIFVG